VLVQRLLGFMMNGLEIEMSQADLESWPIHAARHTLVVNVFPVCLRSSSGISQRQQRHNDSTPPPYSVGFV
jgi:hypothetical protein